MALAQKIDGAAFKAIAESVGKIKAPDWYWHEIFRDWPTTPTSYMWGQKPWRRPPSEPFFYWTDDPYHWTRKPLFMWGAEIARDEAASRPRPVVGEQAISPHELIYSKYAVVFPSHRG